MGMAVALVLIGCGSSDDDTSGDDGGSSGAGSRSGGSGGAHAAGGSAGSHVSGGSSGHQANGGTGGAHANGGGSGTHEDGGSGGTQGGHGGSSDGGQAGADASGGEAGGGSAECPLDAAARDRAETVMEQAVAEASWITTQTHGTGVGADRAFGFGIPFGTLGALYAASILEACTEAKTFDEYCSGSDSGEPGPESCSQLECLEAGTLQITSWFKPLPFTTAAYPGPGEVEVRQARQTAAFTDEDDGSVAIEWTTDLEVVPPGADALTITESGSAIAGDAAHEETHGQVSVDGLTEGGAPLVLDYERGSEDVSGTATIGGEQVLELTNDGPVWSASCGG
jgi:hypothetical protein